MRYVLDASVALRWHLQEERSESVAQRAARGAALGLTGYEAIHAALAEELGACWLTFDARAHERIAAQEISFDLNAGLPASWEAPSTE